MTKTTPKRFHGSCVCGAVAFTVALDLAAGTTRCNCSSCKKARFWMTLVPASAFTLERGADALSDYQRTVPGKDAPFLHFQFCRTCGIRPFTKGGSLPAMGGEFYAVNIACLDDVTDEALAAAPVHYADGAHDDWGATPAIHSFL